MRLYWYSPDGSAEETGSSGRMSDTILYILVYRHYGHLVFPSDCTAESDGIKERKVHEKSPCSCEGPQSVFACFRVRVPAVAALWALSAHKCIDFKVISVISVTRRAELHTMKSYSEIGYSRGRILVGVIFIISNRWPLLEGLFSAAVFSCHIVSHDRKPETGSLSDIIIYENASTCSC